jgi:glycine/D-amino acid oxidase-like deaminating enzyme
MITVIGGGLFGITTAIILADAGYDVILLEKNVDLMTGATLINQNRVHFGYHYPRSLDTGRESLEGLSSFLEMYGSTVNHSFDKYYAISKHGSYLNASEFESFCTNLSIPLIEQWPAENQLNRSEIEACWLVKEPVFDYYELRTLILNELRKRKKIKIIRNAVISKVQKSDDYTITLNNDYTFKTDFIVNATYSGLSDVLQLFDEKPQKGHFELLLLPILKSSVDIASFGVTIMDGPFCSIVPKGFSKNEYILSHVSHSVLQSHLGMNRPEWNAVEGLVEFEIIDACKKYFPILSNMELRESWLITKMVLPNQDIDDARPTLVLKHRDNFFSIFSGKISTCVEAAKSILHQVNSYEKK